MARDSRLPVLRGYSPTYSACKIGTPNAYKAGPSPVSVIRTNSQMKELPPKKRIASGELRQKDRKTQKIQSKDLHEYASRSNQLEGTEEDRLILEDQAQIEEENQVSDRPRAAAAPSQLILTSGIPEEVRIMIARKREEAITKKKDREEGEKVERGTHKKQKSKYSENSKKRNFEALEEEEEDEEEEEEKN